MAAGPFITLITNLRSITLGQEYSGPGFHSVSVVMGHSADRQLSTQSCPSHEAENGQKQSEFLQSWAI